MHNKIKNIVLPLVFTALFITGVVTMLVNAATPVDLYFSPSTRFVNNGSSFSVAVRTSTRGNSVDYVKAYINFPADKLSVTGISAAGSSFDHQVESAVSGSQIKITRYSTTGVKNGDLLIATITFSAINAGTASVNFDGASAAYNTAAGSTQPATATSGGTYTITSPVRPPVSPPVQPPNPPPASPTAPRRGTNPGSPAPATPPPATSEPQPDPVPTSNDQTQLYDVFVTIKDHKHKPAAGVEVHIGEMSFLTNDAGSVSVLLPAGEHAVYVKSAKVSKQFTINVAAEGSGDFDGDGAAQEFNLLLPNPGINVIKIVKTVFAAVLILLIIALVFVLQKRFRHRRKYSQLPSPAPVPAPPLPLFHAPEEPVQLPSPKSETLPVIKLHSAHPPVKHPVSEDQLSKPSNKTEDAGLHPHDTAKTIQPLSKGLETNSPSALLPEPISDESQLKLNKPTPPAAEPAVKPATPKDALPVVDPYKPDGQPKDIFEMAEERFDNDERLKNLRKPKNK